MSHVSKTLLFLGASQMVTLLGLSEVLLRLFFWAGTLKSLFVKLVLVFDDIVSWVYSLFDVF